MINKVLPTPGPPRPGSGEVRTSYYQPASQPSRTSSFVSQHLALSEYTGDFPVTKVE